MADPTPPAAPLGPVQPSERIAAIDILRGLALFGILAANMRAFFAPEAAYMIPTVWFTATPDLIAQHVIDYLIQGKFITLFAFLFGVGFAVQISRAKERGRSVRFYPRRMLILLGLGLIHGALIWWGDILLGYAICGFVLLLFRNRKQKTVAIWALVLFSLPAIGMIAHTIAAATGYASASDTWFSPPARTADEIRKAIAAYRGGPAEHFAQNMRDWANANAPVIPIVLIFVLPRFLAGLWVWRTGLFRDLEQRVSTLQRVRLWSGIIGATGTAAALAVHVGTGATPDKPGIGLFTMQTMGYLLMPVISAFYGSSVLLLAGRREWKPRLAPFGAVGRMALTNYLTQSIVLANLFWLTGLYGRIGPAIGVIVTLLFYWLQLKFSVWWLQRYNFGPAEWLWRALTYGQKPAMRRSPEPAAPDDEQAVSANA